MIAHLDQSRAGNSSNVPQPLIAANYYTMGVSFQMKIIKYALDNYVRDYALNKSGGRKVYTSSVYASLGL